MKLLFCTQCHDVRKLRYEPTLCDCGRSFGRYLSNGHDAEYGGPSRILGLGNGSLLQALHTPGTERPRGPADVLCWVKPMECDRLMRIEGKEFALGATP